MEGNRVLQAIEDPVNPQLIKEDVEPLSAKKMTGDDTFQEVRSILSRIENAADIIEDVDFNMIAATSMISHGVDADRFNLMLFYGIPPSTSEYVQAYSRAGRKHTGIIIDIIRPTREKDQSYLRHFVKFHDYKDILIDGVAINRWAAKAVECTLPGVISALLLNHYRYTLQHSEGTQDISKYGYLKNALDSGKITAEEIKEHAHKIYRCTGENPLGRLYREKIDKMTDKLFAALAGGSFDGNTYLTEVFDRCYFHIMTSLRDTDRQLIVELV
jgi:superfamily II DNA/RNA helicase